MNMRNLFGRIMGFVMIIVTLALAPTILTANATIEAANLTNLTGMAAVSAFGAPLIVLGLLVGGGLFAVAGVRGRLAGASVGDLLSIIGSVVLVIVSLSLFTSVITYTNTLIGPTASGFGDVIYGIIPLVIYIGVIAAAGYTQVRAYRKTRRSSRRSSYA
jgi:amino acid transporter